MDFLVPSQSQTELAAAYLQLAVTLGLVLLCGVLHRRYGKAYFGLWAIAWAVYALRMGAIITFLVTGAEEFLFWHQVTTGWTALALLWATGPMVAFLSVTTAWTAWAFFRYDRLVRSPAARFLVGVLALWAVHHLDYPFLRAEGAWNPWGYYLDIVFEIGMGLGILFLVLEDLDQGLRTLTALSGELQPHPGHEESMTEAMLRRALSLRGVHGSALWLTSVEGGAFVQGAGIAALWPFEGSPDPARRGAERVCRSGTPQVVTAPGRERSPRGSYHAYTAALPVLGEDEVVGALVVVGEARDPFTVLDNRFLVAFGQQVGAALANEDLRTSLQARTVELERLQARMVHQHEEERNRLWRELHDETAQVLAALNLQLGLIGEKSEASLAPALDRAKTLVGEGIKSIRSVTRNLRPMALDDLGLMPALRALARDFQDGETLSIDFTAPAEIHGLAADAEVALYRALQEALANAARHASCRRVRVEMETAPEEATLTVTDDGPGFPEDTALRLRSRGGLAGIRERIGALGGELVLDNAPDGGARVKVRVPLYADAERPEPQEVTT